MSTTIRASVEEIEACLKRNAGDRAKTAAELGMTRETLAKRIKESNALRDRWKLVKVGSASVPKCMMDDDDRLQSDQRQLSAGLSLLQLSTGEQEACLGYQKFHAKHYRQALDVIGGGFVKLTINLGFLGDRLSKEVAAAMDKAKDNITTEETMGKLEVLTKVADTFRKMHAGAERGLMSQIKRANAEAQTGTNGKPKKKYRPMALTQTNINGPVTMIGGTPALPPTEPIEG